MKTWHDIKDAFDPDGSLRDIYVFKADVDLWNTFLQALALSSYRTDFFHGGSRVDLPTRLNEVKALQETDPTILHLWLDENIQINCHFFVKYEIELDVSPHDISSDAAYNALVEFLKWLSRALGQSVALTHEGSPSLRILEIDVPTTCQR